MSKKFVLLSIYDRVNGVYGFPRIFTDNQAATFRTLSYLLKLGRDDDLCTFVDDKEVYQIGTFDCESGVIVPDFKFVIKLKELVLNEKENDSNE